MTDTGEFAPEVRRIVTGHDPDHASIVLLDGPAPKRPRKDPLACATTIWATQGAPDFRAPGDGASLATGLPPPAGGTRFGVLDLAPGREAPGRHRTDTIDYVVCVWGEVTLRLDRAEVVLRPGDTLVQRGTEHAWCNRGAEPARIAFVLLDASTAVAPAAPRQEAVVGGEDLGSA
jgi:quercetin dioxygenase-like cupin family protein